MARSPGVEDANFGIEAKGGRKEDERVSLFCNSTKEHPMGTPNEYIPRN